MRRNVQVSLLLVSAIAIAVAAVALFVSRLYTDWLWFGEVSYTSVFVKMLWARIRASSVGSTIIGVFLLLNLLYARRVPAVPQGKDLEDRVDRILELEPPRIPYVLWAISVLVSWVSGIYLVNNWLTIERFLNAVPFGFNDPIFGRDAGFYVFKLPFFWLCYQVFFWLMVVTGLTSLFVYLVRGAIGRVRSTIVVQPAARRHLYFLVCAALVMKAAGYWLDILRLVYSPRGVVFGASYTDMHAELPALQAAIGLCLAGSVLVGLFSRRRTDRAALITVGTIFVLVIVLRFGYTTLVQQVVVGPDEIAKERPYIQNNITMTRRAFHLENIDERSYEATEFLKRDDIDKNRETVENVRMWDWRPLKQTFGQLQEMRLYYTFNDVDVDRYMLNSQYKQVCLAVREMNQENLAEQAKTWVNRHLKFTHGHGLVVSPANEVGSQGMPIFYLKDIPPQALSPELIVTRPEIYYGELAQDYVIVGAVEDEFDYPLGDQNVMTRYQGGGGIPCGSIAKRLAFTLRFRNYEILLSRAITSQSKILFNRDLKTRVSEVAPFLLLDEDPYPVIYGGRVVWLYDAYTTSDAFPYSQPSPKGMNYIRNSVKATVDAYDGTLKFYLFDPTDPMAQCYSKMFPSLFSPYEDMPDALKKHIRYPADLFEIQAEMYISYHMQDPTVFYNKEDLWSIPPHGKEGHEMKSESYNMIMRLPGEERSEYVSLMTFTPLRKQNMIAWLAARSDAPNYGHILLYKFPKERLVFGPTQVDARIDQDADISPRLTLWGQLGSRVIRGNLRVLPLNGSVLYIEPLYLQATENKLPELKRVLVVYGDKVVMEESLDIALNTIFGKSAESMAVNDRPGAMSLKDLSRRILELLQEARLKSQTGDWAGYGRALTEMSDKMKELSERLAEQK
jgi:uncharacterized protein